MNLCSLRIILDLSSLFQDVFTLKKSAFSKRQLVLLHGSWHLISALGIHNAPALHIYDHNPVCQQSYW